MDELEIVSQLLSVINGAEEEIFKTGIRDWPHSLERSHFPTHFTVSLRCVHQDGSTLIINHPRLGIPTYPGGHLDPGETMAQAALREAYEEVGLNPKRQLLPQVIGVSIHEIPSTASEPIHHHIDVLLEVGNLSSGDFEISGEKIDLFWTKNDPLFCQYCHNGVSHFRQGSPTARTLDNR